MKDKAAKKDLIERNIYSDFRIRQYQIYNDLQGDWEAKEEKLKQIYGEDYKLLKQIQEAQKKQAQKIKEWLDFYTKQNYEVFFFTFTYDDNKRRKPMNMATLKKYVTRALKHAKDYKINFDWGKENGRLHMHGIGIYEDGSEYLPIYKGKAYNKNKKRWFTIYEADNDEAHNEYKRKVGYLNIQKVKNDKANKDKVTNYLKKLVLHSIKENQTYISTKKGTYFQEYQTSKKEARRQAEKGRNTHPHELKFYKETKLYYDIEYKQLFDEMSKEYNETKKIYEALNIKQNEPLQEAEKNEVEYKPMDQETAARTLKNGLKEG